MNRPLWRIIGLAIVAMVWTGCAAQMLVVEPEDIYLEGHAGQVEVTVCNAQDQRIEVRRITCSAGEVFFKKEDLGPLEPGESLTLQVPFTAHLRMNPIVSSQMTYTSTGEAEQEVQASAEWIVDPLPFSFDAARLWAGFMPQRFFYLTWSATWLFETDDAKTLFLNGVNGHTFEGRWYEIARKVDQSAGAPVALTFVCDHPQLIASLAMEGFAVTDSAGTLQVDLDPERFIGLIRTLRALGFVLAPGEGDGTLIQSPES